jgi:hypothetical protein
MDRVKSSWRLAALVVLATVLVGGCYGDSGPGPTPGEMDDVIAAIVLQDVTVLHLTSGDAGCPTSALHDNAVHLTLVIGAQNASHEVYLLRWKNQAAFDNAASDFASCVSEFKAGNPSAGVSQLAAYPWRVYGPGWTPQLSTILTNALYDTGGATPAP